MSGKINPVGKVFFNGSPHAAPPPYSPGNNQTSSISTHPDAQKSSRFKKFKQGLIKIKNALSPSKKPKAETPPPISSAPLPTPSPKVNPPKSIPPPKAIQSQPENESFYERLEKWMVTIISKFENLRSALWKFIQALFGQESG